MMKRGGAHGAGRCGAAPRIRGGEGHQRQRWREMRNDAQEIRNNARRGVIAQGKDSSAPPVFWWGEALLL
jgi:hypothetical protein